MDFLWIREKFLQSKKYWPILKDIIKKDSTILEKDIELQLKAERIFEILSQLLLDICTHIIANSNEPPPQTYAECMKRLSSMKIITPEIAEKASSMVKMRNIVVHQYGNLDYSLLFEGLYQLHEDFFH